jgi:hypothetical protein
MKKTQSKTGQQQHHPHHKYNSLASEESNSYAISKKLQPHYSF